ncbi:MAG: hypothetical protein IPM81_04095 [Saprospirales bacterium]|nr:hypothetical protein [Saprospirales bacterium]
MLQTQESRSVCAGDSTLIFNQWRSTAGVYAQTFSAQNGCDSTHSVALQVLPVLQTQESRSICAGDSTLIFNQWRSAAGVYAQTFSAQNGCDSTHSVALQVLPVLQTQESRSICAGDSTLIFNQWRSAAGVYAQTFSAQNGCDSTHSVALQVLPVLQTQESRSICAGDSVLIFNQWRSTAGVYAQTFSAQNGCDSTHSVALQVLPVLQTQESRSVCAGDSTLIFNQWRSTAGVYAQTFSAQNGCDSTQPKTVRFHPYLAGVPGARRVFARGKIRRGRTVRYSRGKTVAIRRTRWRLIFYLPR